jgi:hypothetical protein
MDAHNVLGQLTRDYKQSVNALVHYIVAGNTNYYELDDIGKVRLLRDWTVKNLPVADSPFYDLPFGVLLAENLTAKRGVWCGGAAYILANLYNIFGFQAITADFGIKGTPTTHVMTFVRFVVNGRPSIIVMDGYLGIEFFNGDAWASLEDILSNIPQGDDENYKVVQTLLDGEKWIQRARTQQRGMLPPILSRGPIADKQKGILRKNIAEIQEHGYKASMYSFFLLPLSLGHEDSTLYNEVRELYKRTLRIAL